MKTLVTHLKRLADEGFHFEVAIVTDSGGSGFCPVLGYSEDGILLGNWDDPNLTCFTPAHAINQALIRTTT